MSTLRDWDKFKRETKGLDHHLETVARNLERQRENQVTPFGTAAAYTKAVDALAEEETTLRGLERMRVQVTALYTAVGEDIVEASDNPLVQSLLMQWGLTAAAAVNDRTNRYLRRGSGITEDSVTFQATHQARRY